MGMSASQARLLSITSRLTNNEFRAQTITNSKLRLATQSSEASQKYMDALTSKKLVFGSYDDNGEKTYTALTPNVLLSYGDLKNQYAMVNTNGQILLSGSDIKTYMSANGDYNKYMELNGVPLVTVDNDKYADQLQSILGSEWADFLSGVNTKDVDSVKGVLRSYLTRVNGVADGIKGTFSTVRAEMDALSDGASYSDTYNSKVANINTLVSATGTGISDLIQTGGVLGNYINVITNPPQITIGKKPELKIPEKPIAPDFATLVAAYNGQQCHSAVSPSQDGLGHMEHNLSALIWGTNGLGHEDIKSRFNGTTIEALDQRSDYVSLTNYAFNDTPTSSALGKALKDYSEYNCVSEMRRSIIDLYCALVQTLHNNGCVGSDYTELNSGRYKLTQSSPATWSGNELYANWEDMYANLSKLQGKLDKEIDERYNALVTQLTNSYNSALEEWNNKYQTLCTKIENWLESFTELPQKVQEAIDALGSSTKEIPDEKHEKYQWYTNLWNRMGAGKFDSNTRKLDTSNFIELEDNLINNENWLKFALEHGIINLEQATFFEDGSTKYPGMGQFDWIAKPYTSAVDIVTQDDEVAIAIAEVEYKNTVTEIENKDKKYDQDLKKLDTEHSALQTEYESIKEVINKNVERSFKAFS